MVAIALMEMAVSIVCEERDHQSGGWNGGRSGLGGGQTLCPINIAKPTSPLPLSFSLVPLQLPLLPSPSCQEKLLFTTQWAYQPQATAPESSGNPSLASDQLSGPRQVTSLSKPQFLHLQNRVQGLALIPSHTKVAQRSHVKKQKCA